jgi:hypothetical protein
VPKGSTEAGVAADAGAADMLTRYSASQPHGRRTLVCLPPPHAPCWGRTTFGCMCWVLQLAVCFQTMVPEAICSLSVCLGFRDMSGSWW